jgi:hypothetical protein
MTLNVYAHAMPEEEADFSFADFGGPIRPQLPKRPQKRKTPSAQVTDGATESLERETGIEPATLSLGRRKKGQK